MIGVLVVVAVIVIISSFYRDVRLSPDDSDEDQSCVAAQACTEQGRTWEPYDSESRGVCNFNDDPSTSESEAQRILMVSYEDRNDADGDGNTEETSCGSANLADYKRRVCKMRHYVSGLTSEQCNNAGICQAGWLGENVNWIWEACTGQLNSNDPSTYQARCKEEKKTYCTTNLPSCRAVFGSGYIELSVEQCTAGEILIG